MVSKARHPKLKRNLVVELRLSSDNKNGFFGSYVFLIVIYHHPKGRLKINIEHSTRKGGIS